MHVTVQSATKAELLLLHWYKLEKTVDKNIPGGGYNGAVTITKITISQSVGGEEK